MAYQLQGRLLEVCDCEVLCPCWIGEHLDYGVCEAALAYHVDKETVEGVDISGLILALIVHILGNVLHGNWKVAVFVDGESPT